MIRTMRSKWGVIQDMMSVIKGELNRFGNAMIDDVWL